MSKTRSLDRSRGAIAGAIGALALVAMPASATINIPEGGAVQQGSVSVITFRVLDGCAGEPTDTIEVTIPPLVTNVTPEAVPGWVLEVEYEGGETSTGGRPREDSTVTSVRWSGGVLAAGTFADFAMRAQFPDEEVAISFPVVQRCGDVAVTWDGDRGSEQAAPSVAVGPDVGARETVRLAEAVESLQTDVTGLQEELSGIDPTNLRSRVRDVEGRLSEVVDRTDQLADLISRLEEEDGGGTG